MPSRCMLGVRESLPGELDVRYARLVHALDELQAAGHAYWGRAAVLPAGSPRQVLLLLLLLVVQSLADWLPCKCRPL